MAALCGGHLPSFKFIHEYCPFGQVEYYLNVFGLLASIFHWATTSQHVVQYFPCHTLYSKALNTHIDCETGRNFFFLLAY